MRFDPLAGNAIHARRSDAHRDRDFVRKRPKNRTGDAIVPATFEAALDAPLGKPNREVRLKAGHEWLCLHHDRRRDQRIADIGQGGNLEKESSGEGLGVLAGRWLRP